MLETRLTKNLLHTTDNYIKSLEKAGVLTVGDLIHHYPRDFEDRTNVLDTFSYVNLKESNTIIVTLVSIDTTKTSGGKTLTKAVLEDKTGFLCEAVWFNKKYFGANILAAKGKKVIVSGKVKYDYGKLSFLSPDIDTDLSKMDGEILSVYPDLNYIPGTWIESKMIFLKPYFEYIKETLPDDIIKKYSFLSKKEALLKLHFPKNKIDLVEAKKRLSYEELYEINLTSLSKKHDTFIKTTGKSLSIPMNPDLMKDIISKLPFSLTSSQKIALFQILKDMEKNHSMQRLLEGDVGTGKTVIALMVAIHCILESIKISGIENKIQSSFMVPTEILARQHYSSVQELLSKFNLTSELLVGSTKKSEKESIKQRLQKGEIDLIIGTHALIQEDVMFKNLGFVVVDEQHRFGVKQREILELGFGNKSGLSPHVLNMTATPIPRTLALTLYGDQDLSVINEYPAGRKVIHTKVSRTTEQRNQIELFVRNELEKGRQVFWISPLVEESEKIDLANAISTYETLVEVFHPFKVGLLHGKMKPKEKDEIMKEFSENKIQVLSSTSVVEVGINVPNATIMCIEGAERFGLSQLHQFRGRVGRGEHQSYCYLFPTNSNTTDRLKAMEATSNGFELAEIDLELRGPGEVYGVRQSGLPDLKLASLTDLELISQIRDDIENLVLKNREIN